MLMLRVFVSLSIGLLILSCGGQKPASEAPTSEDVSKSESGSLPKSVNPSALRLPVNGTPCHELTQLMRGLLYVHLEKNIEDFSSLRQQSIRDLAEELKKDIPEIDIEKCSDIEKLGQFYKNAHYSAYGKMLHLFLQNLDVHSQFFPKALSSTSQSEKNGKKVVTGIVANLRTAHQWIPPKVIKVLDVLAGTPAYGKFNVGDEIIGLNGILFEDLKTGEAFPSLKVTNSEFRYRIKGSETETVLSLKNAKAVYVSSAHGRVVESKGDRFAFLRLRDFYEKSYQDFHRELLSLKKE